jgi:hypothetical protein
MFTRVNHRAARLWRSLLLAGAVSLAGALALPQSAFAAPAAPGAAFVKLKLINGWYTSPYDSATPAVADIAGIVHFRGAISTSDSSTNDVAFILPAGMRPAKYLNVPVDMCGATSGELNIAPNGVTQVISWGLNTAATCFTSLDGASFVLKTAGYTPLKLGSGWVNAANSGRTAVAGMASGIVHFAGEIQATGTNPVVFTLPVKFWPRRNVYIPVSNCTGAIGRLDIQPSGKVTVEGPGDNFSFPQCGTSLEGASFALPPTSFTALKLAKGWTSSPLGTAKAAVRAVGGIVRFRGAIATKGADADVFTLPKALRPANTVYIPVDLCGPATGRLHIAPDGVVAVETGLDGFFQAQCLTSLDGAWFAR